MGLTAAVSVNNATPTAGQKVTGQVTVTNTGAAPVQVIGAVVYTDTPRGGLQITQPEIWCGSGAGLAGVNAVRKSVLNETSDILVFPFDVVGNAPLFTPNT